MKGIVKIVQLPSVVQSELYEATRILFVRKENKNNDFIQQFVSSASSADPRPLGALRKTGSGGGGGDGVENGWDAFVRVSLRLESRSRKALEKQYLFCGSYKLSVFFFFLSKSKRLDDIHVTWFGWFLRRERDSTLH